MLCQYMASADREWFVVMMLDAKCRAIGITTVSIGTLFAAMVRPAEVFKPAILANASTIIIAHNHPSGDTTPSPEDEAVTRELVRAGKLLDIQIQDHIITGEDGKYFSFADERLM